MSESGESAHLTESAEECTFQVPRRTVLNFTGFRCLTGSLTHMLLFERFVAFHTRSRCTQKSLLGSGPLSFEFGEFDVTLVIRRLR